MARWRSSLSCGLSVALSLLASACSEPTTPPQPQPPAMTPPADPPPTPAFEPLPTASAVTKVKALLLGQPVTDEEVAAVAQDPQALRGLIDGWLDRPEFRDRMLAFFQNAFQQNQVDATMLLDQLPLGVRSGSANLTARLLQSVRESFARTAWQIVAEGRPFNETINTRRVMLTPALATYYGVLDNFSVNDRGQTTDRTLQQNPQFSFRLTNTMQVPLAETLDPTHANYMLFSHPTQAPANLAADCKVDPRAYRNPVNLYAFLFGLVDALAPCPNAYATTPPVTEAEYGAWRMVTIRRPQVGESVTPFWDVTAMRSADELVLRVPRVGFFSTPAFFANWSTNSSNQARVTMNQTLIVALGKSFDDSNTTNPITEVALDGQHAGPDTPCYGCHRTLDPMRQAFRQAYSLAYHEQVDPAQNLVNGTFAFGGVQKPLTSIYDLADALASHPRFATAWTQKLCNWANSAPCAEDDPEFLRIAEAFQRSNHNFKGLVRDLFSSPLLTGLAYSKTHEGGVLISIARRDQLCASLSTRLGMADLCGISGLPGLNTFQQRALVLSSVVPSDGYSRGAEAATVANDPNLFFRAGTEALCRTIADQVVDYGATPRYSSKRPQEGIADLVRTVMSLPERDRRAAPALQILGDHYAEAVASGKTPVDALKSTFTLACLSPSSVGSGL